MELLEAIKGRRSVRKFTSELVSKDDLDTIIDAGKCAPSAGNLQARDIFVIRDQAKKDMLMAASLDQKFISASPAVMLVCTNLEKIESYGERGRTLYCIQDSAATCQNMLLAAHGLGLGACWIGAFDSAKVARELNLPEHLVPVAILPIGHPAESPKERRKRSDDVHWM
jgi:nitroreductase